MSDESDQVVVTEAMRNAGGDIVRSWCWENESADVAAEQVFRAMLAAQRGESQEA